MEQPKQIIKFNGGKPVALCNRCSHMMCYVSCVEKDLDKEGNCVVIEKRYRGNGEEYIKTLLGQNPPLFCDQCY